MTVKLCWTCGWWIQDPPTSSEEVDLVNPPTLLGKCSWFVSVGKSKEPKEIPCDSNNLEKCVVDRGCRFWKEKSVV